MTNPKLSNDTKEKISTVFQNYAVNPVKNQLEDLEKKLVGPDNEGCMKNVILDKIDKVQESIPSMKQITEDNKKIKEDLEACKTTIEGTKKEVSSVTPQITGKISDVSQQLKQACIDGEKALSGSEAAVKASVSALHESIEKKLQSREQILLDKIDHLQISGMEQVGQVKADLHEAMEAHHTALSNDIRELNMAQTEIVQALAAEAVRLKKMLQIVCATSGVSAVVALATLILQLVG